jgi:hypothetical protein
MLRDQSGVVGGRYAAGAAPLASASGSRTRSTSRTGPCESAPVLSPADSRTAPDYARYAARSDRRIPLLRLVPVVDTGPPNSRCARVRLADRSTAALARSGGRLLWMEGTAEGPRLTAEGLPSCRSHPQAVYIRRGADLVSVGGLAGRRDGLRDRLGGLPAGRHVGSPRERPLLRRPRRLRSGVTAGGRVACQAPSSVSASASAAARIAWVGMRPLATSSPPA